MEKRHSYCSVRNGIAFPHGRQRKYVSSTPAEADAKLERMIHTNRLSQTVAASIITDGDQNSQIRHPFSQKPHQRLVKYISTVTWTQFQLIVQQFILNNYPDHPKQYWQAKVAIAQSLWVCFRWLSDWYPQESPYLNGCIDKGQMWQIPVPKIHVATTMVTITSSHRIFTVLTLLIHAALSWGWPEKTKMLFLCPSFVNILIVRNKAESFHDREVFFLTHPFLLLPSLAGLLYDRVPRQTIQQSLSPR